MAILLRNSLLEAAEEKIEAGLTPDNRQDYLKIVVSGMKLAIANKQRILATIRASKDQIHDCAAGAVALVLLMRRSATGVMPIKAMIPAGFTLMLQALDLRDKSGVLKIGNDELVRATHLYTNLMLQKLHITPQMIHTGIANVRAITQDPAKMELIHQQSGAVKHPLAKPITPVPGGNNATS